MAFMKLMAVLWSVFFISYPALASPVRGQALYRLCASCHGDQGKGNQKLLAPAIAGLPSWYLKNQLEKFRSGVRGKHPDDAPGLRMYPMARTLRKDSDLVAVAEHVASMTPHFPESTLGGDVSKGQARYATCMACHGPKAAGNKILSAPPLTAMDDWYQLKQLKAFKSGMRAGNPAKDPIGSTMRPMAQMLENEEAMRDVIAYIRSLR